MAEQEPVICQHDDNEDDEHDAGYKPPAECSLAEIQSKDADDEALQKYKKELLGDAAKDANLVVFPDIQSRVVLTTLTMITEGRPDQQVDLRQDDKTLKECAKFVIKEGAEYHIILRFYVQRDIVAGLCYKQNSYKSKVRVDKSSTMIGSYAPSAEEKEYRGKPEEAPKGLLARGSYNIKSSFTDDDKTIYKEWEWALEIVKDYKN